MNIDDTVFVVLHEGWCQDTHKAGQNDEVSTDLIDFLLERLVKTFAGGKGLAFYNHGWNTLALRKLQASGIGFIANHCSDFCCPLLALRGLNDGLHVAATSGDKDNDFLHVSIVPVSPYKPQGNHQKTQKIKALQEML